MPKLGPFQEKLTSSVATLADALAMMSALDKDVSRLSVYANLLADQDTRSGVHQGMRQEMVQLAAAFGAYFWVDRKEQLTGLLMVQESNGQLMRDFENAVMQAIVE